MEEDVKIYVPRIKNINNDAPDFSDKNDYVRIYEVNKIS